MASIEDSGFDVFAESFLDSLTDADFIDTNPDGAPECFSRVGRRFFDEYRGRFGSYPNEATGIRTMWAVCKQYNAGEGTRKSEFVKYLGTTLLTLGDEELKLYEDDEEDYEMTLKGLLEAPEDANQKMSRVNLSSAHRVLDFMKSSRVDSITFTPGNIVMSRDGTNYSLEDFDVAKQEPFSLLSDPIDFEYFTQLLSVMAEIESPEDGGRGEFEIPGRGKYSLSIENSEQGRVLEIRAETFSPDD